MADDFLGDDLQHEEEHPPPLRANGLKIDNDNIYIL